MGPKRAAVTQHNLVLSAGLRPWGGRLVLGAVPDGGGEGGGEGGEGGAFGKGFLSRVPGRGLEKGSMSRVPGLALGTWPGLGISGFLGIQIARNQICSGGERCVFARSAQTLRNVGQWSPLPQPPYHPKGGRRGTLAFV